MEEFSRAILLLLAAALFLAVITEGPGGARTWIASKFLGAETG